MPIMKVIYGIHNPNYKSDEAVFRLSEKIGLQGDIYRLKSYTESNRKKYRYLGNAMPDVLVFNSRGELTKFEINCSNKLDSIVGLRPQQIDSMNTLTKGLKEFKEDSYTINATVNDEILGNHKPVFVLKFADFAGRLNKDNVPKLIERLKPRKDVDYILLNMDYTIKE